MDYARFANPPEQRYFEDYVAGAVHRLGSIDVDPDELVDFARRFDPQPMHTDPEAAVESVHGGLIASGWHTGSLMMRLITDHYLPSGPASIGSPGIDELRWVRPVRPGDRLTVIASILETRRSESRPDRGLVRTRFEVVNQRDETVMTVEGINFMLRRPESCGSGPPG